MYLVLNHLVPPQSGELHDDDVSVAVCSVELLFVGVFCRRFDWCPIPWIPIKGHVLLRQVLGVKESRDMYLVMILHGHCVYYCMWVYHEVV